MRLKFSFYAICFLFGISGSCFAQKSETLCFSSEGKFKIVQFTDMHYVIGSDECKKVLDMVNQTLDEEKPHLVIFTGDIITSSPQAEGWKQVLDPVIKRQIPWAAVLGNHDDEYDLSRESIVSFLEKQPYSLVKRERNKTRGTTDYVLEIKGKTKKTEGLLYCMDSHAYSKYESIKG